MEQHVKTKILRQQQIRELDTRKNLKMVGHTDIQRARQEVADCQLALQKAKARLGYALRHGTQPPPVVVYPKKAITPTKYNVPAAKRVREAAAGGDRRPSGEARKMASARHAKAPATRNATR